MKAEFRAARTAKRKRKIKRNKRKDDICRFETVLLTVKPFFLCKNHGASCGRATVGRAERRKTHLSGAE